MANERSVLGCVDQSEASIAACGPTTAQYCDLWTNHRIVLPVVGGHAPGLGAQVVVEWLPPKPEVVLLAAVSV